MRIAVAAHYTSKEGGSGGVDASSMGLARFILSPQGQEILAGYGFDAAAMPR